MIRVLVVEDDPMLAKIHMNFVENLNGFEVVGVANDGVTALEMLKTSNIDLVVLDIYMPKMDGLKLIDEMRRESIQSDLILVTASKDVEQVQQALKFGVFDYLVKPFEFERLKRSLIQYKSRVDTLKSNEVVEQSLIDKMLLRDEKQVVYALPKGLHQKTLDRIRKSVERYTDRFVDIETISEELAMSNVTVRRYLEYMASVDEVEIEMNYGTRGRPSFKYKYRK
ncbi:MULTISPECIES: response regulator [unclassified Fusibacter]|uniref:response regulator n=1 Tax=unclassified Fusibacter TaxID=2624464 RepID=UPI0010117929|nr:MULTISPECIES: response regulator [unclassified Fusibacter]MCK8059163.1 response regulator [Fusibacter sp. A2]NPE22572.1 response regulator [Fusibacter sp. A1]RXV60674.1 response regulator [Fusibacter sp. A1]